jgi:hypothetical protein
MPNFSSVTTTSYMKMATKSYSTGIGFLSVIILLTLAPTANNAEDSVSCRRVDPASRLEAAFVRASGADWIKGNTYGE